ncbi:hypothetical protein CFC21_070932 [Triticum aestivum]|uniref:Cyclin-like domain-containing protein n=2 Tax=Triticum aestivum TaxID=4565 RepID=A0A3B6LJJ7_WHEAT|nr:hypothetical protein CFC21_070932 [Triticum aestivum]
MLWPWLEGLDLAVVRKYAIDGIWKLIKSANSLPLTPALSVNYLDRFLFVYPFPEGKAWVTRLLAVARFCLALKMEETYVSLPMDLQVIEAKSALEAMTIKRMERLLLAHLLTTSFATSIIMTHPPCSHSPARPTPSRAQLKERVLRCHKLIQDKITMGTTVIKSVGSSMFYVPQSPIGVLDAVVCLSQQSDDTVVGSLAT